MRKINYKKYYIAQPTSMAQADNMYAVIGEDKIHRNSSLDTLPKKTPRMETSEQSVKKATKILAKLWRES